MSSTLSIMAIPANSLYKVCTLISHPSLAYHNNTASFWNVKSFSCLSSLFSFPGSSHLVQLALGTARTWFGKSYSCSYLEVTVSKPKIMLVFGSCLWVLSDLFWSCQIISKTTIGETITTEKLFERISRASITLEFFILT